MKCKNCDCNATPKVTKNRNWIKSQLRSAGIKFEEFSGGLIVLDEDNDNHHPERDREMFEIDKANPKA